MLKIYKNSFLYLNNLFSFFQLFLNGFWLGILSEKTLDKIDEMYYESEQLYYTDSHNLRGLSEWEENVTFQYFQNCKNILLLAAGGGREVYGLYKRGFKVDAFECNTKLVEFGNKFLEKNAVPNKIVLADRNECPQISDKYSGAVVGWGAYMLIQGRSKRINLLKSISRQLDPNAALLISFATRSRDAKTFLISAKIANFLRFILRRKSIELGDSLLPNIKYIHFFSKIEIESEFNEAGFELKYYETKPYGHAVGICKKDRVK